MEWQVFAQNDNWKIIITKWDFAIKANASEISFK